MSGKILSEEQIEECRECVVGDSLGPAAINNKWLTHLCDSHDELRRQLAEAQKELKRLTGGIDALHAAEGSIVYILQARATAVERERDEARAELAELRRISRAQDKDIAHTNAVLDWTMDALRGEEVSDFAESFPEVRQAEDFRAEADELRKRVAGLGGSLAACREAMGDQAGERLYESIAVVRAENDALRAEVERYKQNTDLFTSRLCEALGMHDYSKGGIGNSFSLHTAIGIAIERLERIADSNSSNQSQSLARPDARSGESTNSHPAAALEFQGTAGNDGAVSSRTPAASVICNKCSGAGRICRLCDGSGKIGSAGGGVAPPWERPCPDCASAPLETGAESTRLRSNSAPVAVIPAPVSPTPCTHCDGEGTNYDYCTIEAPCMAEPDCAYCDGTGEAEPASGGGGVTDG